MPLSVSIWVPQLCWFFLDKEVPRIGTDCKGVKYTVLNVFVTFIVILFLFNGSKEWSLPAADTLCFLKVMAKLSLAQTTVLGHAIFRHWMRGFGTSRFLQDVWQCFSEVMAKLLLARTTVLGSAIFHHCMRAFCIPRFLLVEITQYFSEATAKLLLAGRTILGNAGFHRWMRGLGTLRFLQAEVIQCFSEAMAKPLLPDTTAFGNARFHAWRKDFSTRRFQQEKITQFFSEVMGKPLLAGRTVLGNAGFRRWMRGFGTSRLLQAEFTQCFSGATAKLSFAGMTALGNATFPYCMRELCIPRFRRAELTQCFWEVMAKLLLAGKIRMVNATFRLLSPLTNTFALQRLRKIWFCKSIWNFEPMKIWSFLLALDWMDGRCCAWKLKNLTQQWAPSSRWHENWVLASKTFDWFCRTDSCLLQSGEQIHLRLYPMFKRHEVQMRRTSNLRLKLLIPSNNHRICFHNHYLHRIFLWPDFHTYNQVDLVSFSNRIKPTDPPWCTEMHQCRRNLPNQAVQAWNCLFQQWSFFFNEAWRVPIRYS